MIIQHRNAVLRDQDHVPDLGSLTQVIEPLGDVLERVVVLAERVTQHPQYSRLLHIDPLLDWQVPRDGSLQVPCHPEHGEVGVSEDDEAQDAVHDEREPAQQGPQRQA